MNTKDRAEELFGFISGAFTNWASMEANGCDVETSIKLAIEQALTEARNEALENVTRFEVIDENGRAYVRHGVKVEQSLQDDGRTLKVFIKGGER